MTERDSLGDRVSRLEAGYEHLVTKADLERLFNRMLLALLAVSAVVVAILRLWPQ